MADTAALRNRLPVFNILVLFYSPGLSGSNQAKDWPEQPTECKVSLSGHRGSLCYCLRRRDDVIHHAKVERALDRLPVVLHSLGLASLWQLHLQRLQSDQPRGECSSTTQRHRGEKRESTKQAETQIAHYKSGKDNACHQFLGHRCVWLAFLLHDWRVYGMYSKVVHPSPWPWLAFQSSFRLVELTMAFAIAYSVMQPAEANNSSKKRNASASSKQGEAEVSLRVKE